MTNNVRTPYCRNRNGKEHIQYTYIHTHRTYTVRIYRYVCIWCEKRKMWVKEFTQTYGILFDPVTITLDSIKWKIKSNHIDEGNEKL